VTKPEFEFFDTDAIPWEPVLGRPGVSERVLARDPDSGLVTRLVQWDPGLDTAADGPVAHPYVEEVFIIAGAIHDLTLDRTFTAHHYGCRPPGMRHGPWRTEKGCVMLEVQSAPRRRSSRPVDSETRSI
jgi:ChrR Cupin-like domain